MKSRYEERCKELESQIVAVIGEKERLESDLRRETDQSMVRGAATVPGTPAHAASSARGSKEGAINHHSASRMRRQELEGKLVEVNHHLSALKRQQTEAQRLLRVKEQQERRIANMTGEIARLKSQRGSIDSRLKTML